MDLELQIPKPTKNAFHNDSLKYFNERLYKDILTTSNVVSKEQAYEFKKKGSQEGYRLEKHNDLKTYFLKSEDIRNLPIKIQETQRDTFRTDVLHIITKCDTVKIPSEKTTSFRNLVDWMCNFEHDNPTHWKIYKILIIASVVDRLNTRVHTNAGFGKDSMVNAIIDLVNKTANIYGATFAKLEYYLLNKFLFFNEIGGLKEADRQNFQTFFLEVGAFSNTYNKHSRKTSRTKEKYDISETSVGIAGNYNDYYSTKNQDPFVKQFTKAVNNRFLELKFKGVLTQDFSENFNLDNVVKSNQTFYKKIISTLNWYRDNGRKLDPTDWNYHPTRDFGYGGNRKKLSYERVCKYISFYAIDREEYKFLSDELYKCYKAQLKDDNKVLGVDDYSEGKLKVVEENI